jgi:hypothetical protein
LPSVSSKIRFDQSARRRASAKSRQHFGDGGPWQATHRHADDVVVPHQSGQGFLERLADIELDVSVGAGRDSTRMSGR